MLSFSLFNTIIISRWNLKSLWISLILFFFVKSWLGENNGIQVVVETIKWGGYFSSRPFLRNSNIRLAADLLWFFLCSPQKQLSMSWKTTNFKQKTLINQTVMSNHNRHRVNVRIRLLKKKSHLPLCQWRKMTFLTFLCGVLWCQFVLISTKHLSKYLLNL